MATQTFRQYLYAYFDENGSFSYFDLLKYKTGEEMGQYGMHVLLREFDLPVEVPDSMHEVNMRAAKALDAFILEEKGKHQVRMMKLEAARNAMLGIEWSGGKEAGERHRYDDVVEVTPKFLNYPEGGVDDIPF